jgi:hypothetical protein
MSKTQIAFMVFVAFLWGFVAGHVRGQHVAWNTARQLVTVAMDGIKATQIVWTCPECSPASGAEPARGGTYVAEKCQPLSGGGVTCLAR